MSQKRSCSAAEKLGISQDNFDEAISKFYSTKGRRSRSQCREAFRRRLSEVYRLILICKHLGFVGLTSGNYSEARGEGHRGVWASESANVSKLRQDLETAEEGLHSIKVNILIGVQWIHSQCPSAPKSKRAKALCIKIGLEVVERLLRTSDQHATTRSFMRWRLISQFDFNKFKVREFKKFASCNKFGRALYQIRTRILKHRFKVWIIFLKKKRKEERVTSSINTQRFWRGFACRQWARRMRLLKTSCKLQSFVRGYIARVLLQQIRVEQLILEAMDILQSNVRRWMELHRFRKMVKENKASVKMQAPMRKFLSKTVLRLKWHQRVDAAITLQCAWRRRSASCKTLNLRRLRKPRMIQRAWRGSVARKKVFVIKYAIAKSHGRKFDAAARIQACAAYFCTRKRLRRNSEDAAARIVQKNINRFSRDLRRARHEAFARVIQSGIRMWSSRRLLAEKKIKKEQTELLRELKRQQLLNDGACRLQRHARLSQTTDTTKELRFLREKRMGAVVLQKHTRRHLTRNFQQEIKDLIVANRRRKAAVAIQYGLSTEFRWRNSKKQQIAKQENVAATTMQRHFRSSLACNVTNLRRAQKLKQHHVLSAAAIQSTLRQKWARTLVSELMLQKAQARVRKEEQAGAAIQCSWRTRQAREKRRYQANQELSKNIIRTSAARRVTLAIRDGALTLRERTGRVASQHPARIPMLEAAGNKGVQDIQEMKGKIASAGRSKTEQHPQTNITRANRKKEGRLHLARKP